MRGAGRPSRLMRRRRHRARARRCRASPPRLSRTPRASAPEVGAARRACRSSHAAPPNAQARCVGTPRPVHVGRYRSWHASSLIRVTRGIRAHRMTQSLADGSECPLATGHARMSPTLVRRVGVGPTRALPANGRRRRRADWSMITVAPGAIDKSAVDDGLRDHCRRLSEEPRREAP